MRLSSWLSRFHSLSVRSDRPTTRRRRRIRQISANHAEVLEDRTLLAANLLDVDLNERTDALSDGIVFIRQFASFTGETLVQNAVDPGGARTSPTEIEAALTSLVNSGQLDIDADGSTTALSDGILILRHLALFEGDALVAKAANPDGQRNNATSIKQYLTELENAGVLDLFSLREGAGFAVEHTESVDLGVENGRRTLEIDLTAGFDGTDTTSLSTDRFQIYLVDPNDPADTLLDRGTPGTSVFSLTESGADYDPGRVRFDGTTVEIDVTSITNPAAGSLVFQSLNGDQDDGSSWTVIDIRNVVDPEGTESQPFPRSANQVEPGDEADVDAWTATDTANVELKNVRYNSSDGSYSADLRIRNVDLAATRNLALSFPSLPAGVTVNNASGSTSAGVPYINFQPATPLGGLTRGSWSLPITIEIANPDGTRFLLSPRILAGPANQPPTLASIDTLTVLPGRTLTVQLSATDPDGDRVTYSLRTDSRLPPGKLSAAGQLTFTPSPQDVGTHTFQVVASDRVLQTIQSVMLEVPADPVQTTRISGVILNTLEEPLAGVPIELDTASTATATDGTFTVEITGDLADDALKIHGEAITGSATYPFIAEKLNLLLDHDAFEGVENVIMRPIYLPALNISGATTIDPAADTTVSVELVDGEMPALVFVAQESLKTQAGGMFDGQLSITEVPIERTPAAIPRNLFPDTIVTIQPGEMVFDVPAPLTLPNRADYPAGTRMDLWSINPETGDFEVVGVGRVSNDGSVVETISGGIRNSSWHLFTPTFPGSNTNGGGNNGEDGMEGETEDDADDDPDSQPLGADSGSNQCGGCGDAPPQATLSTASEVELYSGAYIEEHQLVTYQSLGASRGLTLRYKSTWAAPEPILTFYINGVPDWVARDPAQQRLYASVTVTSNAVSYQVPGYTGNDPRFKVGEHYWKAPTGGGRADAALPLDLGGLKTGIYDYELSVGFRRNGVGAGTELTGPIVNVNQQSSSLGAGWSIAGVQSLHEADNGDILLVDGAGATRHFESVDGESDAFASPVGDFSTMKRIAGRIERTMKDGTVYRFDSANRLSTVTSAVGNVTTYNYDTSGRLNSMTDPVGLKTTLVYAADNVRITDPANRVTTLSLDAAGNLIAIADPDGTTRRFEYDQDHRLTQETNQRGNVEQTQYDSLGRVTTVISPDRLEFNIVPYEVQGVDQSGTTSDPLSAPTARSFGSVRNATWSDRSGDVHTVVLNDFGQIRRSGDSIGVGDRITRNGNNLITQVTDARGSTTFTTHDALGNIATVARPGVGQSDGTARITSPFPNSVDFLYYAGIDKTFDFADVNGDQRADLVGIHTEKRGDVGVFLADANGNYTLSRSISVSAAEAVGVVGYRNVRFVDLDGDGDQDVAGIAEFNNSDVSGQALFTIENHGDGEYSSSFTTFEHLDLRISGFTRDYVVDFGNDFTGDGIPDAGFKRFLESDSEYRVYMTVFPGTGGPRFSDPIDTLLEVHDKRTTSLAAATQSVIVGAADFNGDGISDLLMARDLDASDIYQAYTPEAFVLLGTTSGEFQPTTQNAIGNVAAGAKAAIRSFFVGDFDDNGLDDILFLLEEDIDVDRLGVTNSLYFISSQGSTFASPVKTNVELDDSGIFLRGGFVGDVNADGNVDVIARVAKGFPRFESGIFRQADNVSIYFGQSTGDFQPGQVFHYGDGAAHIDEERVAYVDTNADGIRDIVLKYLADITTIQGIGNGRFSPLTEIYSHDPDGNTAAQFLVDVNGDAAIDVVGIRENTSSLWLNNGFGEFTAGPDLPAGANAVAAADFDGDGDIDFIDGPVGINNSLRLIENFGTDPLDPSVVKLERGNSFSAGHRFNRYEAFDIDADGDIDLLGVETGRIAFDGTVTEGFLQPWLNDGDAGFTEGMAIAIVGDIAFSDLDRNGLPDIVTAQPSRVIGADVDIVIIRQESVGTFRRIVIGRGLSITQYDRDIQLLVTDITDNGWDDIVFVTDVDGPDGATSIISVQQFSQAQEGTFIAEEPLQIFRSVHEFSNAEGNSGSSAADFDLDGDIDVIIGSEFENFLVYLENTNGHLALANSVFRGKSGTDIPKQVLSADVDRDGDTDLFVNGTVIFNETIGSSIGVASRQEFTFDERFAVPTSLIDESGRQTLFDIDPKNGTVLAIREVRGDASSSGLTARTYGRPVDTAIAARVGDTSPRIIVAESTAPEGGALKVFVPSGASGLTLEQELAFGNITSVIATDFNNDGADDIAYVEDFPLDIRAGLKLFYSIGAADGSFAIPVEIPLPGTFIDRVPHLSAGDANGDGVTDLILGHGAVSIVINTLTDGNPDFTTVIQPEPPDLIGGFALHATVANVDGKNGPDIVAAYSESIGREAGGGRVVVYLDDGSGSYTLNLIEPNTGVPAGLAVGDVDGDGLSDIVVAGTIGDSSRFGIRNTYGLWQFLSTGDATLYEFTADNDAPRTPTFSLAESPTDIQLHDVDSDGVIDLVYSLQDGYVVAGLGNGTGRFPTRITHQAGTQALSVEIGDINVDGTLDLLLANGDNGTITQILNAIGSVGGDDDLITQFEYTAAGQVARVTDSRGLATRFRYDNLGRVQERILPMIGAGPAATEHFEYDAAGNQTLLRDANGNVTRFEYDLMNRLTKVTESDPDGSGPLTSTVTTFTYDAAGNLLTTTDGRGNTTTNVYDVMDRLVRVIDNDNNATAFDFDNNGNVTTVVDALQHGTRNVYDARNRLIRTIDADGGETTFQYDANDNLTKLTDPVGNTTQFRYDARNRLVLEIDPLGKSTRYTYDAVDNLVQKIDRNGRISTFAYDDLDRLIRETWIDADSSTVANEITYEYDRNSNLTHINDEFSELTYTYDARDRVETVSNAGTPEVPVVVLSYTYDAAGNITSVTDTIDGQPGATTAYDYDGQNRVKSIRQSGTDVTAKRVDFTYNQLGQYDTIDRFASLTADAASRVAQSTYTYDNLSRLDLLDHRNQAGERINFFDLEFDGTDRIRSIEDIDGRTVYSYDDRNQLTAADRATTDARGDESYTYDANGNRTQSHRHGSGYVTDAGNRLVSDGTFTYDYDNEGNIIRRDAADGATRTFTYDHRNRLVAVSDTDRSGGQLLVVRYKYDTLDRRTTKSIAGDDISTVVTRFIYDREDVLVDIERGVPALRYLHGSGIDQVISQEDLRTGTTLWLLTNHLETTSELVDDDGKVTSAIRVDSFGNVTNPASSDTVTRYVFTGRETDFDVNLTFFRSRYYDSRLGRFISEDALRFVGGDPNLFAYVANRANDFVDPFGFDSLSLKDASQLVNDPKKKSREIALNDAKKAALEQIKESAGKIAKKRLPPRVNNALNKAGKLNNLVKKAVAPIAIACDVNKGKDIDDAVYDNLGFPDIENEFGPMLENLSQKIGPYLEDAGRLSDEYIIQPAQNYLFGDE